MAAWKAGGWRKASKGFAVPLTKLQIYALRVLAAQRSPDSYVAGGVALNRAGVTAAEADAAALVEAGLKLSWGRVQTGKRQAQIEGLGEAMQLEWVADSDFRFFSAQPDELFGYALHPVDLATNKASAAADRREPRDIIDLVTIHESILPLGAVICAAVGRFPGLSPEEMLSEITRHSRFTAEEFRVLATERPLEVSDVHRRIRNMIEDAERFISEIPSDDVGVVFLDGDKPIQPEMGALAKYQRRSGARRGMWPSSAGITDAMLDRYQESPNP
jgi:hypothetical protein